MVFFPKLMHAEAHYNVSFYHLSFKTKSSANFIKKRTVVLQVAQEMYIQPEVSIICYYHECLHQDVPSYDKTTSILLYLPMDASLVFTFTVFLLSFYIFSHLVFSVVIYSLSQFLILSKASCCHPCVCNKCPSHCILNFSNSSIFSRTLFHGLGWLVSCTECSALD